MPAATDPADEQKEEMKSFLIDLMRYPVLGYVTVRLIEKLKKRAKSR